MFSVAASILNGQPALHTVAVDEADPHRAPLDHCGPEQI